MCSGLATPVIDDAQSDVHPWQCVSLPFDNDCARTVFVSSMFTLSLMEEDSQPNVVSHYEQIFRTQKVCISWPMFIRLFFLVLVGITTSQNIRHFFNTLYSRRLQGVEVERAPCAPPVDSEPWWISSIAESVGKGWSAVFILGTNLLLTKWVLG